MDICPDGICGRTEVPARVLSATLDGQRSNCSRNMFCSGTCVHCLHAFVGMLLVFSFIVLSGSYLQCTSCKSRPPLCRPSTTPPPIQSVISITLKQFDIIGYNSFINSTCIYCFCFESSVGKKSEVRDRNMMGYGGTDTSKNNKWVCLVNRIYNTSYEHHLVTMLWQFASYCKERQG